MLSRIYQSPFAKTCQYKLRRTLLSHRKIERWFSNDGRDSARDSRRRTLKEQALAPAGDMAFDSGQAAIAGGALFALGALGFYGLGMSKEPGAIDHAVVWPEYVRQRVQDTYMYFGTSMALTAASATAVYRSPPLLYAIASGGFMTIAMTMVLQIGSMLTVMALPYHEGFGAKHLAWLVFNSITGAVIAPICLLGGPIVMRAAWYTAGVVAGLSTIAFCAPSERFLYMGAPLAIGLGIVFAASIATIFLPPTTAIGAGMYAISLYGGLLLFSAFMLYDTQKIIHAAERYPLGAEHPFDPINASIGIYLDTINIFIRLAEIFAQKDVKQRRK